MVDICHCFKFKEKGNKCGRKEMKVRKGKEKEERGSKEITPL
jgi:hypothetical protein